MSLYDLARTALFTLDAEHAHELTIESFSRFPRLATAPFAGGVVEDPAEFLGLRLRNRVGLAAGLDKNGAAIAAWQRLGFGFIEVGTTTPRPQPGNPRPRMFRLPRQQALINRLGFNNQGVDMLLANVRAARRRGFDGVLGINIGKNFDTPIERAADDYLACLRKVYLDASYVTVNISSPNTKGLRDLQDEARLEALLAALRDERDRLSHQHGRHTPILVKIAPDVSDAQIEHIGDAAPRYGIDGLIATNTTIGRAGVEAEPLAAQQGGLSGAPLRPLAEATLRKLRKRVGRTYPLIGVGGIGSGADAQARRESGADVVQVYTGFIYRGPALIGEAARALAARHRDA